jgi:hypothetical protein
VPPLVLINAPAAIVLVSVPGVSEVTSTFTVQVLFCGILPPVRATVLDNTLATPPQLVTVLGVGAKLMPAGKMSVRVVIASGTAFGLLSVIVRVLTSPANICVGVKLFATVGFVKITVGAVTVLLAPAFAAGSLELVTAATLLSGVAAFAAMFTVTVMSSKLEPAAKPSVRVQVLVTQVQPIPLKLPTSVIPAGTVSVTVVVAPAASAEIPIFVTRIV